MQKKSRLGKGVAHGEEDGTRKGTAFTKGKVARLSWGEKTRDKIERERGVKRPKGKL